MEIARVKKVLEIKCWLDDLGVKHAFTPEIGKCHMHRSGKCAEEIEFFF